MRAHLRITPVPIGLLAVAVATAVPVAPASPHRLPADDHAHEAPAAEGAAANGDRRDEAAGRRGLWDWSPAPLDEAIETDRPDFTESTSAVPLGHVQFELGYTFTYDRRGAARVKHHVLPEGLMRLGVLERSELRIGWEGYSFEETLVRRRNDAGRRVWMKDHDDGGTDLAIGLKQELWEQDAAIPAFSVIAEISAPTGAAGKTSGDVDPAVKLLYAWDLNERLSVGGNLNFAVPTEETGRFFQTSASLAAGYALTDWMSVYGEYFGFYPNGRNADAAHYLNGGFTFPVHDNFQIDLRAGFGLNEEADNFFTGIGFAFRI